MIDVVDHGAVRELRLARPPVNALDPGLIAALRAALAEAVAGGREAIVLSGAPGRFSGGLDVPALLQLDRAGIQRLWTDFFGLMRDLAALAGADRHRDHRPQPRGRRGARDLHRLPRDGRRARSWSASTKCRSA